MIFTSIRWRIQAWHGALLLAVVTGFGFTAHRLASENRMRQIDEELQGHSVQLSIAVPPTSAGGAPGPGNRRSPTREPGSLTDSITSSGAWFVVWQPDGSVQVRSSNAPAELTVPGHVPGDEFHAMRTRGDMREFVRFTKADRCFLVGRDIHSQLAELRQLGWYLTSACATVLVLGLLGGWWLSTRAIRPIQDISATAEKISAGDLSQRVDAGGFADELRRLAEVLNSTFSRLEAAFAQQARFSADAAHELRTPVSVMLTHAQNGLASEPLTEEQREAFQASQRAAQRMRRLIESLLELSRFDAGQEDLKREVFDTGEMARDCVTLLQPLAAAHDVNLRCEISAAPCVGDATRVSQVITNLLSNAIEYNRRNGEVRVKVQMQNGSALLEIADTGVGIAQAELPHIFERFRRGDASRSGSQHAGLGLAICQAIVTAHGGSIEATSEPGLGSTFTVRLPGGTFPNR
jgi:heavy metal sensor kinase